MKKVIFNQAGNPQDVLEIKETDIPEVGAGQVRIKVKAASVNPADGLFIQGYYGIKPKFPESPVGLEGAGEIDAIGTGIGDGIQISKGMRVAFSTIGSWAEYVVVPANAVLPVPEELSWEQGAQLFVNPFTALAMLDEVNLQKGDWLLLTAGFSALNKMVIRIAKERGIKTICTVRREEQVEPLLKLGAEAVINTEKDAVSERVNALTEGKGAQACFESIGGKISEEVLNSMGQNGKMMVYGVLSGQPFQVNGGLMIFKELSIKGFWLSEWMKNAGITTIAKLGKELHKLAKEDALHIEYGETFPLEKAADAVDFSNKAGKSGKAVIVCN
ncbi:zinc-dependent alcohol dehydrogenase family protein [Porifericola rhodea]|uniref:zinc-dependent alcohol dehydrogenase family protein n=1 Tax=Porifericola rhodea TaxID=930972 RepID=UPI0026656874|nr:zinc-dependent alcohol dehydrogenase family protein [Porifericola rhodea]WKN33521.1 zinc-dependent alcohol dehydrogenase family protein [Porifericola rhodea]